jgi:hypothetical protein
VRAQPLKAVLDGPVIPVRRRIYDCLTDVSRDEEFMLGMDHRLP